MLIYPLSLYNHYVSFQYPPMKNFYTLIVALFLMNGAMAQWVPQNSGTTNILNSVFFTDAYTGYVLGYNNIDSVSGIIKTNDAGTTWSPFTTLIAKELHCIYFTDANTGYVVGDSGTILKTVDAGTTWNTLSSGVTERLNSVYFTNSNIGYVCGQGVILKTSNAGTTWTVSYVNSGIWLNSIYFPDESIGYAVGYNINSDEDLVLKTINSGTTWTASSIDTNSCGLFSVFFTNSDTGFAVGYGARIAKTIDAGTTWTITGECTPFSYSLSSVYFTDDSTGYAVGGDLWAGAIIQKTVDCGISWDWTFFENSIYQIGVFNSVFFTGIDTGYVVGWNGGILKTTNGGVVGINDHNQTINTLPIYPNPAKDNITIETHTKGSLFIHNISGQQLLQQDITETATTIDVSGLKSGVYFVRVTGERAVLVGKFIKQ